MNHPLTQRFFSEAARTRLTSILLIEDNPADVRLVQELWPSDGLSLMVVAGLEAGLAYLAEHAVDLILLELELPDSQGVETLIRLRAIVPDMAIVVLTQFEQDNAGVLALQHGAQDFLAKDQMTRALLLRTLHYAFERQRMAQALRESEERFRATFEQAAVGMAYVDLEGHFLEVNQKLCDILGYTPDELVGKSVSDITHEGDVDMGLAQIEHALTGQQDQYIIDKRYVCKSGEVIWVNLTVSLVRARDGQPKYFVGIVQNITSRKEAEQAQQYLAAIVESSEDGIIGKRLDGTIRSWNAAAERIFGYTTDEVIGQSISLIFPPGYEEEYEQILARIRRGERITRFETKRMRKDGRHIDIALTVSPIKNEHGEVIGASTIERDITMLKWAQTAQKESEERLRQLTENINEILWLKDAHSSQLLYVSPATASVWHLERERLYEQPTAYVDRIHPDDRQRIMEAVQAHQTGELDEEFRIVLPEGQERWIHARTFPIYNAAGEVYRTAGIAEDITDYKLLMIAEQEQRTLAESLRDIANALNSTPDTAEVLDRLLINIERVVPHDAAEIMLIEHGEVKVVRSKGYTSRGLDAEFAALNFSLTETPNLRYMYQTREPLIIPDIRQAAGNTQLIESEALFWRSYAGVPIHLKGSVIGFINLGSVTPYFFTPVHADRLQGFAEQAAIAIHNARLYAQSRELAAHQERQRLARDLHDAVSQTLFSATITAEALSMRWHSNPEIVGPKLADIHRLTRGALAETRAVLLELRPEVLTEISFDELVKQLAEATQSRKNVAIALDLKQVDLLPAEVKLVFYRITQEALNNIVKHAQATRVNISLSTVNGQTVLKIQDDGQGFDPAEIQPMSMGLGFMRERAETIGATLTIDSFAGQGTCLRITWQNPIAKESS